MRTEIDIPECRDKTGSARSLIFTAVRWLQVCIQVHEVVISCRSHSICECTALAAVLGIRKEPHRREGTHDISRPIGRAVIDDDHFIKQPMRRSDVEYLGDARRLFMRANDAR